MADHSSSSEMWRLLRADLGDELLAQLVRVPSADLNRYAVDVAIDAVEARGRYLARVRHYLCGTYNPWGMQRWFVRPRAALGGRSPLQHLSDAGDWTPESPVATDVETLARALAIGNLAT